MATSASVSVMAHVKPDTPLSFAPYQDGHGVAVDIGEFGGCVTVFLPRSEIDRLADLLVQARESLNVSPVKAAA